MINDKGCCGNAQLIGDTVDLELLKIVDTADEAVKHIVDFYSKYLLKPNF